MTAQGRRLFLLYGTTATAYVLDRGTKILAEQHLAGRPPIRLVGDIVHLRFTTNAGGAFGIFGGRPWLFFGATVLVSAVIVAMSPKVASNLSAIGLGLILGGALGNLTDRIIRGPGVSGRVVDFIDLRIWPVFNVADSAIVIGALVVAFAAFRREP
ncbi:MAG: signal peptidase II [Actinomycetota bacterium]|nr:signal peptidase II [Actinomycetota bacterium]